MKGKALKKGMHEKFEKVLHEGKEGTLHSGSKDGPIVRDRSQMLAIAFSEARKQKRGKKK